MPGDIIKGLIVACVIRRIRLTNGPTPPLLNLKAPHEFNTTENRSNPLIIIQGFYFAIRRIGEINKSTPPSPDRKAPHEFNNTGNRSNPLMIIQGFYLPPPSLPRGGNLQPLSPLTCPNFLIVFLRGLKYLLYRFLHLQN